MKEASLNMFGYVDKNGDKKYPYKDIISGKGYSENIFFFPEGLPGFENNKEFAFVFNTNTNPYILMNFCGETKLSFMCIDPFWIVSDYKPILSREDKLILNVDSEKEAVFLAIVKINKDNVEKGNMSNGSLILKSPLVINPQNCYAKQILLSNSKYAKPYDYRSIIRFRSI